MYGDVEVMRGRAAQLRAQGVDLRALADHLVDQTEAVDWSGRAAESMRERIRTRADELRQSADRHDAAADSLQRHLLEVDGLQQAIATHQLRATELADAGRMPPGFTAPPDGHPDWLAVRLPGS